MIFNRRSAFRSVPPASKWHFPSRRYRAPSGNWRNRHRQEKHTLCRKNPLSSGRRSEPLTNASERPPRTGSPVSGQHGQPYGELEQAEERLVEHVPSRASRGEHPPEFQDGRRYAQHAENEGDDDQ